MIDPQDSQEFVLNTIHSR